MHQDVVDDLREALTGTVPGGWRLTTGVGVRMPRLGPERYVVPDLLAATASSWTLETGEHRSQWRMTPDVPGRDLLAGVALDRLTAGPR